jgi:flagellar biosynthesis/type III secretory pathway protein FliH
MGSHVYKSEDVTALAPRELHARNPEEMLQHGDYDRTGQLGFDEFLRLPAREQIAYLEERYRIVTSECEGMVAAAREQSEEILATALKQSDELKQQARKEGYAAGQAAVKDAVRRELAAQMAPIISALETARVDTAPARERYFDSLADPVLSMLLEMAHRLFWEDQATPQRLAKLTAAAFAMMKEPPALELLLNPEDALLADGAEFTAALSQAGLSRDRITITPDPAVKRGGATARFKDANLVFSPDELLARLRADLAAECSAEAR